MVVSTAIAGFVIGSIVTEAFVIWVTVSQVRRAREGPLQKRVAVAGLLLLTMILMAFFAAQSFRERHGFGIFGTFDWAQFGLLSAVFCTPLVIGAVLAVFGKHA